MANGTDFYTVKRGETLSEVAQRHGTTADQLCRINGIKNPDKIEAGQKIALNAKAVCKVTVQLLDREHNPIPNAKVRMDYGAKRKVLSSGKNGRVPAILTTTPEDQVKIFIACADGTWKQITEVTSGWGNKLVTLVSPKIKIEAKTRPHPKDASGRPILDPGTTGKIPVKPPSHPETTESKGMLQALFGDNKGLKSEQTTGRSGLPILTLSNDQVKFDFLSGYTGEKITDNDYRKAAKELGCEVEVLKAIGEQESGKLKALGLGSFDKQHRPTILYERHCFSKLTNGTYDKTNSDISSPTAYIAGTVKKDKKYFDDGNHYGLFSWQYMKFAKAYALNKDAAIRSCSWGTFQVMGDNFNICGFGSSFEFAKAMSKSELEHLKALVAFCKGNKLQHALITKNWPIIAKVYNGPSYKKNEYDQYLKDYYEMFLQRGKQK
jgi:LysM repeat protein